MKRLRDYLDQSFAPFRKLPPGNVEVSWERVLQRQRDEAEDAAENMAIDSESIRPSLRWRGPVFALAAAAVVLAVVISTMTDRSPVRGAVMEGSLYRVSGGKTEALRVGQHIADGEVIRSNSGKGAVISLADTSSIEMRSASELFLEGTDDGVRIHLSKGGILVDAAKQRTGRLYVQTKDMTVSVVGTVFLVNAEEAGSRVAVIEGEVHVQQRTSEKNLKPGEQTATNPRMEQIPVKEDIGWSRNAEAHLALLQQSANIAAVTPKARLEFESTSIKPEQPVPYGTNVSSGAPVCRGSDGRFGYSAQGLVAPQGRCVGRYVSLYWLIAYAYDLSPATSDRVVLGAKDPLGRLPADRRWMNNHWEHGFSIEAKAENPESTTTRQLRQMLQAMLEDRFKLKIQRETRDVQGYTLSIGRDPHKLQQASSDEPLVLTQKMVGGEQQINVKGNATVQQFAEGFDPYEVFDKTDLKGPYAFNFTYVIPAPSPVAADAPGGGRGGGAPAPGSSPRFRALQSALRDQLGLQLEFGNVPVDVVIVEHAEKPSEN
jgi:uncharacterized protein (TIGR03435 family)